MLTDSQKLILLLIRCVLFGLVGGTLFTVISGQSPGPIPYIAAMGAGAGWSVTRPFGFVVAGKDGLILTVFLLAIRIGLSVLLGWLILVPYSIYLVVRTIRS